MAKNYAKNQPENILQYKKDPLFTAKLTPRVIQSDIGGSSEVAKIYAKNQPENILQYKKDPIFTANLTPRDIQPDIPEKNPEYDINISPKTKPQLRPDRALDSGLVNSTSIVGDKYSNLGQVGGDIVKEGGFSGSISDTGCLLAEFKPESGLNNSSDKYIGACTNSDSCAKASLFGGQLTVISDSELDICTKVDSNIIDTMNLKDGRKED